MPLQNTARKKERKVFEMKSDLYIAAGGMAIAAILFAVSTQNRFSQLWKIGLAIMALTFALSYYDAGRTLQGIQDAFKGFGSTDTSVPAITVPDSGDPCDLTSAFYDPTASC